MALTDNLVCYYKLDESSGTVLDATGNGHTGTNYGATTEAVSLPSGNVGTCYDFERDNTDYIDFGDFDITTDKITISAWIKAETFSGGEQFIVGKDVSGQRQFNLGTNADRKLMFTFGSPRPTPVYGATSMNAGTWYHVAFVFDSSTDSGEYFLNGVSDNAVTATANLINTTSSLMIGRRAYVGAEGYFDGKIDEVGIWNRVLSSDEISELYNNGNGLTYPFTAVGTTRKIKISGTFQDKPIKTKVAGTFVDKPIKIKVGGTFQ